MELTNKDTDSAKVRNSQDGPVFLNEEQPSSGSGVSLTIALVKSFKGNDALSCANILRSRNKTWGESFPEAVRLDPQNACALTHCGILYKDEGRLVEAVEMYQKAPKADSSYKLAAECLAIVLTDLGTSLKLAGNTQEGIQKYYEAIKIDPHYAPAYYNLGVIYSEMMQYDTALNCYEKAAVERPMYVEAYCNIGVIYKNHGNLESPIAYYERCL
ncbi:hypothetical protein AAHA92_15553 [Salvia divinorum]|uniref:UDP-N-acetylglucosamine--peptide N-acetylglucosaminyltransferase SPINDLY n=1 Tax=Salvia divinorum TaxID=28513 RepID=A0ABD1HJ36_SALDI